MTKKLWEHTGHELAGMVAAGDVSAVEVTDSVIGRMERVEPDVHAYLMPTAERARADAQRVDHARAAGEKLGPLAAVPMTLKDIICTEGVRTSAASKILDNYIPPYSATVAERMAAAGLPLLGKTNLDEFAMGSSTENSAYGPTCNPWDLGRVPGGSSGGTAAAVAAGQAVVGLGTDTGGSIRQPAGLCGVVGLKPTYGLVSRFGLIAFASSLDQAGPITRDVRDAALVLQTIAGHDPMDSTSLPDPVPNYSAKLGEGIDGLKIGVVKQISQQGVSEAVQTRFREAVSILEKLGAQVGEVSLPTFDYGIDIYYLIAPSEASSNLARYEGVRFGLRIDAPDVLSMNSRTRAAGFGAEVKRRIMLGTYCLSAGYYDAYYLKAQKARTLIRQDFDRAYKDFDLLISPSAPTTAFAMGEKLQDPLTMYLSDVCNVPTSLAGAAAMSVPCGVSDEDGMPVGIQFMAPALGEETMLKAAYAFEQKLAFDAKPALWSAS